MKKAALHVLVLGLSSIALMRCMTPATIRPIYATRAVSVVDGEIAFKLPVYKGSGGDPSSLGAIRLESRIDDYFSKAFQQELQAFGLRVNQDARLLIQADIIRAETLWAKQGPDGVFSTDVEIQFTVLDHLEGDRVVYHQVHRGEASHSQSYGGYPASASVVDALSQTYTRLFSDPAFHSLLVKGYGYSVAKAAAPEGSQTGVGDALQLEQADLEAFPILMKYYDDHPVGRIVLKNISGSPVSNVELSLFVKEYMDDPKPCGTLTEIRDSASMDLYALFNSSILSVTEGTKVSSVIRAEYTAGGERLSQSFTVTLRVYGRNSLTWDDDRKAAAFVTAKDPTVLRFAKNSTALVSELAAGNMNKNLRKAIVLHEALALYGIRYEVVPASVFKTRKDSRAIDSLQFPKQTLEYKAGNCSDITILYSALLESVGIDTAFITVPGHIFMAFALDQDQDKDSVPRAADFPRAFFEKDGVAWVPVETTLVNDSFAKAWQEGAREWAQDGTGAFYPVRDAWQSFEPVDFNEQAASVAAPAHDQLAGRCAQSVDQVAAWQMALPESKLKQALARNPEDPALANKLAVLYARYGKYDMAVSTLGDVVKRADYLPAIINMGTASFMLKDFAKARDCYQKALLLQPNNAAALAQLSRACFELGDFQHSSNYFAQLKTLDASLADKYAYLAGEGGTRSAERDEAASRME